MRVPSNIEAAVFLSVGDLDLIHDALSKYEPDCGLLQMRGEHRDDLIKAFYAMLYGNKPDLKKPE